MRLRGVPNGSPIHNFPFRPMAIYKWCITIHNFPITISSCLNAAVAQRHYDGPTHPSIAHIYNLVIDLICFIYSQTHSSHCLQEIQGQAKHMQTLSLVVAPQHTFSLCVREQATVRIIVKVRALPKYKNERLSCLVVPSAFFRKRIVFGWHILCILIIC